MNLIGENPNWRKRKKPASERKLIRERLEERGKFIHFTDGRFIAVLGEEPAKKRKAPR